MEWLFTNLQYFTNPQQSALILTVTEDKFLQLQESDQNNIKYLFFQLSTSTPKSTVDALYQCVMELILFDDPLFMFKVNEGQSFTLNIEKDVGEYDGLKIVARENITKELLTSPVLDPVNNGVDSLKFIDLPLSGGGFYKVNILLELESNGQASGDVETPVGSVYFIVGQDQDSDAG